MTEASPEQAHGHGGMQRLSAPLLALNLGIAGHRPHRMPEDLGPIRAMLEHVFKRVRDELTHLPERNAFSSAPPQLRLVSPLAAGADVIAGEVAIQAGYELAACLPFAPEEYRRDFPGEASQRAFDALLAKAGSVIELAGGRDAENAAYETAGLTMLSFSDLVVAVWDGVHAAGPGGTAEILARAVDNDIPVIHIPVEPDGKIEIVWAGLDEAPLTRPTLWTAPRFDFETGIGRVVRSLTAPPDDPAMQLIAEALERPSGRFMRLHFAWPLLLRLFGAHRFKPEPGPGPVRIRPIAKAHSRLRAARRSITGLRSILLRSAKRRTVRRRSTARSTAAASCSISPWPGSPCLPRLPASPGKSCSPGSCRLSLSPKLPRLPR